jgi:hypothetical protein
LADPLLGHMDRAPSRRGFALGSPPCPGSLCRQL